MISLQPKPATRAEPDSVVIFGPPKIGKNTLLVGLPNHYIFELQPKGMAAISGRLDEMLISRPSRAISFDD